MKPTFGVLIPNYNDGAQIAHVLQCVHDQTVPFDEVLIIDDASTDDSVQVIEDLIKDIPHARLHRNEKNMGVVACANLGFDLIKSDYIHGMSANDLYSTRIVETAQRLLARFPDAAMVSGNAALLNAETGERLPDLIVRLPQEEAFITSADYIARNRAAPVSLSGGANMIRRDVYLALKGQDGGMKWYADWFLYFLIGFTHGFIYVPMLLTTFRLEGRKNFSSARFDWQKDKPVLSYMLDVMRTHPEWGKYFRETAVFPHYHFRILALALQPEHRWFITPLFVWRCIGHQGAFWLKAVLPRALLMTLRRFLRL